MHQPLPVVKAMPLGELYVWAHLSAGMVGKTF
jgi:hypothetical protein